MLHSTRVITCPSCRNRAIGIATMLTMPNDDRDKIVCRACGEVLQRRPMQTLGEALLVWSVVLASAIPAVVLGGVPGVVATIFLIVFMAWVAPWQGMTYQLSSYLDDVRPQLPAAKIMTLPSGEAPETGTVPPKRRDPPV